MKKRILIGLLLGVAFAAGALFWYVGRPDATGLRPAELLPGDTLALIEADDLAKSVDAFMAGPLGQALSGIDMPACLGAFNAEPEEIERVSRLQAGLKAGIDSPWFDTLFGDLSAVAFLPPAPDDPGAPQEPVWQKSVIMVLRPQKPAEMIQWIAKMFADDAAVTAQTVDGVPMDRIERPDAPPLFAATHRGLGLVALDPQPIVRCLAPAAGMSPSLALAPDFIASREALGMPEKSLFHAYINLHGILGRWMDPPDHSQLAQPAQPARPDTAAMADARTLWTGFGQARPVMSVAAVDGGEAVHHRMRIVYDPQKLSPEAARMLGVPPEPNRTLPWIPEPVLYYSWQNSLEQVLTSLLEAPDLDSEDAAEIRREFAAVTGVPLADALEAFGRQLAVVIRDIRTGGMFPVPELALMIEADDPDVIQRLMENAARSFGLAMATEDFHGTSIRYAALPYGDDISPGYAMREGFLMVASSREVLKSLLAQGDGWKGLADAPSFKAVGGGLSEPNNQMVYVHTGEAAFRMQNLVRWGLSLAVMTGKAGDANQMIYLSNKVVEPLLEALSRYPAAASRTIVLEDGIQSDMTILKPVAE